MKSRRLIRVLSITVALLLFSACERQEPQKMKEKEDRIVTTFYCYLTTEGTAKKLGADLDLPEENYAEKLKLKSYRLAAERFCDSNLVDHFTCILTAMTTGQSVDLFCKQPPDFDQSTMLQCNDRVSKYFKTTVTRKVEEINQTIIKSVSSSDQTGKTTIKDYFNENCIGLL